MLLLLLLFEEENTWGHVGLVLSRSFYVNRTWTTIDRWSSSLCARYTLSHRPYKRTSPYDSSHKLRLKDSLAIIVAISVGFCEKYILGRDSSIDRSM